MIDFISAKTKRNILGLLILAIAGFSAGCGTKAEMPKPKSETAAQTNPERVELDPFYEMRPEGDMEYSTPAPKKTLTNLTKATFEKIKIGMTLVEVEIVMGEKGMLVSTKDADGKKMQIFKWSSGNFTSYIDVTIEDGKVTGKKEKGLK